MKTVNVDCEYHLRRITFNDDALADQAYAALKAAIESYEKFSNDKTKCVTFKTESGEFTFRLDNLRNVGITDHDLDEETIIAMSVDKARLEAKVAARLAPNGSSHSEVKD